MIPKNRRALAARIAQISAAAIQAKGYVSAVDVLLGIGWLTPAALDDWRRGRAPFLERVVQANLSRVSEAMKLFRAWAAQAKLRPSPTAYVRHGKGPRTPLRFSKSGAPPIEKAYSTHWVAPRLVEEKRKRETERASTTPAVSSNEGVVRAGQQPAPTKQAPIG
ncbi:MAG: hypothetical protein K8H88_11670 [Sandaracinaceae bacterium]|nr:hypothetical protein [Sandaracinaceae bacterium]